MNSSRFYIDCYFYGFYIDSKTFGMYSIPVPLSLPRVRTFSEALKEELSKKVDDLSKTISSKPLSHEPRRWLCQASSVCPQESSVS